MSVALRKPEPDQIKIYMTVFAEMSLGKDAEKRIGEKVLLAMQNKQFACVKAFFMKPYHLPDDIAKKCDEIRATWTKDERAMIRIPKGIHQAAKKRLPLAPISENVLASLAKK